MSSSAVPDDAPVLFFDGVCGLCNRTVDFAMRHDRSQSIRFAPLQGETAARLLPSQFLERLDTVVFRKNGRTYARSSAIVSLINEFGGVWKLAAWLLWLIPGPLRNLGYRCVAKVRYRFFGKHEACRLPSPDERARFLD